MTHQQFNTIVNVQGRQLYRDMPWRHAEADGLFDAYKILVSEMMLQQTQVTRVIPKFLAFIKCYPTAKALANAPLADVLLVWSGLGYNRRARYIHEAAKKLHAVAQPWSLETLVSCKGIGPNTARAVRVYAYNKPEVFIETNIRTVVIHYFFSEAQEVSDTEILKVVKDCLDIKTPRNWYWHIMDIGANLKASHESYLSLATSYKKQTRFEGSLRQIRGNILKQLANGPIESGVLKAIVGDERYVQAKKSLLADKLIYEKDSMVCLGSDK